MMLPEKRSTNQPRERCIDMKTKRDTFVSASTVTGVSDSHCEKQYSPIASEEEASRSSRRVTLENSWQSCNNPSTTVIRRLNTEEFGINILSYFPLFTSSLH
jgi:hypothetical protein